MELLLLLQDADPESTRAALGGLDLVGLGIVGLLVVLGIARGLWWQVIRLVGIVAAVVVARLYGGPAAEWIVNRWPDLSPRLAYGAGWLGVFLGTMAVATVIGMLGHRILEAMQLGLANRLAGGLLGAATGVVVHLALIVGICQLAPSSFVERNVVGTYSEDLYEAADGRWEMLLDPVAAAEVQGLLRTSERREAAEQGLVEDVDGPRD